MKAVDMEQFLEDLLTESDDTYGVATFEEQGILTTDRGLIVTMKDLSVFQITIVKAK